MPYLVKKKKTRVPPPLPPIPLSEWIVHEVVVPKVITISKRPVSVAEEVHTVLNPITIGNNF
jgi:hypothetical protein